MRPIHHIMFSYLKYFFYLAFNWNFRIAWTVIRGEVRGEKKYGISTTGADELRELEKNGVDIEHATIYMPVHYPLLEDLLGRLTISGRHHFIDIGCGKGRALCVAASTGFERVTGIDFSPDLCADARKNLDLTRSRYPKLTGSIVNNDAFYFEIPDDSDCIFLFNPFDEVIMSGVAANLAESLKNNPRKMNIIYVNPLHMEYFTGLGFSVSYHTKKMQFLEAVILEN
ncbi:MAG: class I SAM-dependent methyltransferase [Chitinophagaceae bacterium]|nr:class I SAM-dependent methyltransferase [Chitinophagaceae bacterium]